VYRNGTASKKLQSPLGYETVFLKRREMSASPLPTMGTWSSPEVKRLVRGVDHPLHLQRRLKKE
jgi:hypothetical protein